VTAFTEPEPPRSLTDALARIDWLCQPPHTLDQIIGIHAEASSRLPALPAFATPTQLARHLDSIAALGSSHADPTSTGRDKPPPSDLAPIDEQVWQLCQTARDLDDHATAEAGSSPWRPPGKPVTRTEQLRDATTRIHHARSVGLDSHDCADTLHFVWERAFTECAGWLHLKALGIWHASKGETQQVAEQRTVKGCGACGQWRTGTIAGPSGLCDQCKDFRYHHKCRPTEAIVRRWEATGKSSTPPGMILEAQAAAGKKAKAS
jgi:hypothetical protein